jgi:hypothetical protein
MQRSLSDVWKQLAEHNSSTPSDFITISKNMSARRRGNCIQVKMQLTLNNYRHTRSIACGNFLAFVSAFNTLRQEVDAMISAKIQEAPAKNIDYEKREIANIKKYLDLKRAEYAEKEAAKRQALEIHISKTIGKVRPMVQYVLNRYKPVVDQFAYANVYGRPVEKIFY